MFLGTKIYYGGSMNNREPQKEPLTHPYSHPWKYVKGKVRLSLIVPTIKITHLQAPLLFFVLVCLFFIDWKMLLMNCYFKQPCSYGQMSGSPQWSSILVDILTRGVCTHQRPFIESSHFFFALSFLSL